MTTIEDRLQNWARYVKDRPARERHCPTGLLCDRMRKAALGNVWSGHEVSDPVDEADAERLEKAWRKLLKPQRDLLKLYYVKHATWQQICVRVRVRVSRELFDGRLKAAQEAVEFVLQKGN